MAHSDSYVRAINLLGIEQVLAQHGHQIRPLMEELEIPTSALTDVDSLISFPAVVALFDTAATRYNIPDLGVELMHYNSPEFANLGPLLMMSKFVRNVEEWVETALRYWSFHTNGFTFKLIKQKNQNQAILQYVADPFALPARQWAEGTFTNIVALARIATDRPDENPLRVCFQHRKPADTTMLDKFFRCPVEYGQLHSEVAFTFDILNYKTSGSLKLFKPLMAAYITERIRRMHLYDRSAKATVILAISSIIGTGKCSVESVAEAMNISSKLLQRRLNTEKTSFSELFETTRLTLAKQYLQESNASIAAIAGLLDYGSTPPFSTAFRGWTGQTPLEFRKRHNNSFENKLGAAAP